MFSDICKRGGLCLIITKFEKVEQRLNELISDYGNMSVDNLEKKYNASYATIQRVLKKNNIISSNSKNIKYVFIREHEEEFKKDWIAGVMSKEDLIKKYKCPYSNIKSIARDLGIKRKTKLERINKESLIEDWNSKQYHSYELLTKYNISSSILGKVIKDEVDDYGKRNGRIYYFNYRYFDYIDNEHKAYWLGFIYADGSHNEKRHTLRICLQEQDAELLRLFYKDIGCNRELHFIYNKTYDKYYPYVYVQHPHLSETLNKQGVPSNKSFKITFPSTTIVPHNLMRHFIRGYFDGDGGLTLPEDKRKVSCSFVGNYKFITDLKYYLLNYSPHFTDVTLIKPKQCEHVYLFSKAGRYNVERLLRWMYEDSTIYLKRKYNKYVDLVNYNKERLVEYNKGIS